MGGFRIAISNPNIENLIFLAFNARNLPEISWDLVLSKLNKRNN